MRLSIRIKKLKRKFKLTNKSFRYVRKFTKPLKIKIWDGIGGSSAKIPFKKVYDFSRYIQRRESTPFMEFVYDYDKRKRLFHPKRLLAMGNPLNHRQQKVIEYKKWKQNKKLGNLLKKVKPVNNLRRPFITYNRYNKLCILLRRFKINKTKNIIKKWIRIKKHAALKKKLAKLKKHAKKKKNKKFPKKKKKLSKKKQKKENPRLTFKKRLISYRIALKKRKNNFKKRTKLDIDKNKILKLFKNKLIKQEISEDLKFVQRRIKLVMGTRKNRVEILRLKMNRELQNDKEAFWAYCKDIVSKNKYWTVVEERFESLKGYTYKEKLKILATEFLIRNKIKTAETFKVFDEIMKPKKKVMDKTKHQYRKEKDKEMEEFRIRNSKIKGRRKIQNFRTYYANNKFHGAIVPFMLKYVKVNPLSLKTFLNIEKTSRSYNFAYFNFYNDINARLNRKFNLMFFRNKKYIFEKKELLKFYNHFKSELKLKKSKFLKKLKSNKEKYLDYHVYGSSTRKREISQYRKIVKLLKTIDKKINSVKKYLISTTKPKGRLLFYKDKMFFLDRKTINNLKEAPFNKYNNSNTSLASVQNKSITTAPKFLNLNSFIYHIKNLKKKKRKVKKKKKIYLKPIIRRKIYRFNKRGIKSSRMSLFKRIVLAKSNANYSSFVYRQNKIINKYLRKVKRKTLPRKLKKKRNNRIRKKLRKKFKYILNRKKTPKHKKRKQFKKAVRKYKESLKQKQLEQKRINKEKRESLKKAQRLSMLNKMKKRRRRFPVSQNQTNINFITDLQKLISFVKDYKGVLNHFDINVLKYIVKTNKIFAEKKKERLNIQKEKEEYRLLNPRVRKYKKEKKKKMTPRMLRIIAKKEKKKKLEEEKLKQEEEEKKKENLQNNSDVINNQQITVDTKNTDSIVQK